MTMFKVDGFDLNEVNTDANPFALPETGIVSYKIEKFSVGRSMSGNPKFIYDMKVKYDDGQTAEIRHQFTWAQKHLVGKFLKATEGERASEVAKSGEFQAEKYIGFTGKGEIWHDVYTKNGEEKTLVCIELMPAGGFWDKPIMKSKVPDNSHKRDPKIESPTGSYNYNNPPVETYDDKIPF